jgi:cytochrome c oxidase subunit 2
MSRPLTPIVAGLLALAGTGCDGTQTPLAPAGPQASSIAALIGIFFAVCAVVYVLTIGALAWALARRRAASDATAESDRRITRVIVGAAAVTVLTLVVLTATSVFAGRGLTSPSGPGAVTVDVIGHQWWWEFQYHDVSANEWVTSPNELHIPVGVPVAIKAQSRDVIHSFWVPNLNGKRDLIPGMVTHTWIQADRPGIFRGQCAEFCGHQHAHMAFLVVAEPPEAFARWLQAQRRPAEPPATDARRRGHDLVVRGSCAMCHAIRGTSAGSRIGPDLTHLASRRSLAAATLPNDPAALATWIADPQAIKPGNRMPPHPYRDDELRAIVDYLGSLR